MKLLMPVFLALIALALPAARASTLPDYPFVSTSGKAQSWIKPDVGEIDFDATAQRPHADAAAAAMATVSSELLQALAAHGVAPSDIDSFEVTRKPVILSRPADDGSAAAALITRHFHVQVRDLAQWPELIAALLAQEDVEAMSVRFDRSDRDEIDARLSAEAARDARARGALLAEAMGRKLGAATAISQGALGQVAGNYGLAESGGGSAKRAGDAPSTARSADYAVPNALSFQQAVNVIFKLK